MKCILLLSLLFCLYGVKAQEIQYFPQEQIVFDKCEDSSVPPDCTYSYFEGKVSAFLNQNKKMLKRFENDTIKCRATLVVGSDGKIDDNESHIRIRSKSIPSKIKKKLKAVFNGLLITKVLNSKQPLISKHFFKFNYSVSNSNSELRFHLVKSEDRYAGGVIEEIPIFQGCEELDDKNSRICFQQKMITHIERNFQYPSLALQKKLKGKVDLFCLITKEGEVTKIRAKGPHSILEKDAIEIMKRLPKMTPAKQNGVPVRVPFSIPITYKL